MALDFLAGCIGGCAGIIIGHPLDTVKVHLQTANSLRYNGTLHCLKTLLAKEGLRGIYRGISSPLLGVAGINAIVFGVYGNTQRNLPQPESLLSHLLAGSTAGLFQSIFCSPMELVKSRLQVSNDNQSLVECLKKIYQTENGIRGVFRGLNMTIAREVPAFGSYFLTYEYLTRTEDNAPVSTLSMLIAGGLAGIVSWTIVYPIDVIKSRLQIDGINGVNHYTSSYDCLKKGLKSDGSKFLFRGLTPTLIRAFPVNAVTFTVVTWTIRLFNDTSETLSRLNNNDNTNNNNGNNSETLWGRCTDAVCTLKVSEPVPS